MRVAIFIVVLSSRVSKCAEVSVSKYYSLYKKIGRKFGDGNGTTTFNLPNYMNEIPNAVFIIKYK